MTDGGLLWGLAHTVRLRSPSLPSAPEARESRWCRPSLSLKAWDQGSQWCKPQSESAVPWSQERHCPKAWEDGCLSSCKEKINFPLLCLFVLFRPSKDWTVPICTDEADLYSVTRSNANLLQKHPHRHNQQCLPAFWASLGLVKLTHKFNHDSSLSLSACVHISLFLSFSYVPLIFFVSICDNTTLL